MGRNSLNGPKGCPEHNSLIGFPFNNECRRCVSEARKIYARRWVGVIDKLQQVLQVSGRAKAALILQFQSDTPVVYSSMSRDETIEMFRENADQLLPNEQEEVPLIGQFHSTNIWHRRVNKLREDFKKPRKNSKLLSKALPVIDISYFHADFPESMTMPIIVSNSTVR